MARNPASGATVAMAAGGVAAGTAMTGAAVGTGYALAHVNRRLKQGDLGWDRDGNFVCGEFVFNFATRQIFDGSETHYASDVEEIRCVNGVALLSLRGRAVPKQIVVQTDARGETVVGLVKKMWDGQKLEPDNSPRLPSFDERVHRMTASHLIRYAVRSAVIGLALGGFTAAMLDLRDAGGWAVLGFAAASFGVSVLHRKKRIATAPKWAVA